MRKIFKDFIQQEIEVGDTVIFMQRNHRSLVFGRIKEITECTVLIEHNAVGTCFSLTRQRHSQVVKVRSKDK